MIILHIETSTNVCSIALSKDGNCIFEISNNEGLNHAAMLSPFIQKAIDFLKKNELKLDAVAVSGGPGSYTGLRIGVSTAKGLCFGYDIPLITVSTLEILCIEAMKRVEIEKEALLCPMIDARRMEVYTALFTPSLEIKEEITAKIMDENTFNKELENQPVYFFGNGSEKCKSILLHPNARFIEGVEPLAKNMIPLAEKKFSKQEFSDVAYYEPFYLKEFQATIPKNKLNNTPQDTPQQK